MPRRPLHERLYRALLSLFPSEFRGDFGEAMTRDFRDQRRDAEGRPREVRRLWARTIVDVLYRAPREHLDVLWHDVAYAFRVLAKHPVASATAILSLAVGIGLNSAVYSVVSGVLWRSLPLDGSDRLVTIGTVTASYPQPGAIVDKLFLDVQQRTRTFDGVAGGAMTSLTVVAPGEPAQVGCLAMTEGLFDVLRVRPVLGRAFTRAEYRCGVRHPFRREEQRLRLLLPHTDHRDPQRSTVAHALCRQSRGHWHRHDDCGRAAPGDRGSHGTGARRARPVDAWPVLESPTPPTLRSERGGRVWSSAGWRRAAPSPKPTPSSTSSARISRTTASTKEPRALRAVGVLDNIVGRVRTQLVFLFGAVMCVLLVTCANVVQPVSGARRRPAPRARDESRAWRVAPASHPSVADREPGHLAARWHRRVSPRECGPCRSCSRWRRQTFRDCRGSPSTGTRFAFTLFVSTAVGLVCGILAALPTQAAPRARVRIRAGGNDSSSRADRRHAVTVCEIALALMLAVAATLMVRTLRALNAIELGFDPRAVVSADLSSMEAGLREAQDVDTTIIERVKALPGVRAAGIGLGPLARRNGPRRPHHSGRPEGVGHGRCGRSEPRLLRGAWRAAAGRPLLRTARCSPRRTNGGSGQSVCCAHLLERYGPARENSH